MTAPDVNADVRARFEAWWVIGHKAINDGLERLANGEYAHCGPHDAWEGYRAAHAAHAALAGEVREWRSIEIPPAVASAASYPVLVCLPEFGVRMGWYTKAYADKGEWPWSADGFCDLTNQTITYWMPRPEPPAALAKFHPTHQEKPDV